MSAADTDPLRRTLDQLTAAIAALTDSDAWRTLLTVAAHLPTYSPHNLMLIASQRPDATHVAGFGAWQRAGRQVRHGEHGIGILAPVTPRRSIPTAEQTSQQPDTSHPDTEPLRPAPAPAPAQRPSRRFRVVYVFDVSQTDGPPLPQVTPRLLDGAAPPGLWDELSGQIEVAGFALIRGDCAPANGLTDYATRTVTVAADLTPAQAVKTLAHELAHVRLHGPNSPTGMSRPVAEVEAESVAYLVMTAHGLDPTDYTVPYVTGWSGGDPKLIAATAERVLANARQILTPAATAPAARVEPAARVATRTARRHPTRQPAVVARPRPARSLEMDR